MAIVEGTTSLPAVQAVASGAATYDGTNLWLWRADNATARNVRVALYDAAGNPLLVAANPGVVNLTQVNGVALLAGAGNTGTGSPRVTIASDQAAIPVTLSTDTDVIGQVSINQTTPGTTDRVTVGATTTILQIPTISTSPAYTAGDNVGAKITLASAVRVSGGTGIIQSLTLSDKGKQSAATDVVFFSANPTNTTATDNTAQTIHDTDLLTIIGVVSIVAADWFAFVDNSVAAKLGLGLAFKAVGSTSIYAILVTRGTPTYSSTTDLQLGVSILMD